MRGKIFHHRERRVIGYGQWAIGEGKRSVERGAESGEPREKINIERRGAGVRSQNSGATEDKEKKGRL